MIFLNKSNKILFFMIEKNFVGGLFKKREYI